MNNVVQVVADSKVPPLVSLPKDLVDPQFIHIKGARTNNLRNVELRIPKNKLVVVTGVSGSGKSSITLDTLYSEGQRRYVESLSSYARQFLGRMKKPDVDFIRGICPAIAIEQRVSTGNTRSTVGSMTEINDFLRLLFARVGIFYSPVSGREVRKHEVQDVVDYLKSLLPGSRAYLLAPFPSDVRDRKFGQQLQLLLQKGFTRLQCGEETYRIEDLLSDSQVSLEIPLGDASMADWRLLVDRMVVEDEMDASTWMRLADSVHTAFAESEGYCAIMLADGVVVEFNNRFEQDGIVFPEPTPQLFNYNNPFGACPTCEGYGRVLGIDRSKVIPDASKSVYEGAIAVWKGDKWGEWLEPLIQHAHRFDFPLHTPYGELSKAEQQLLWRGNEYFYGIDAFFQELESKLYKIQNRVTLARYRGRTLCPVCEGGRLRPEALCVRVGDSNLSDLMELPLDALSRYFQELHLSDHAMAVAKRLLMEIRSRLRFLTELGLGYLTLDRVSNTLSGGETQRIHLTRTLGSNLTSSMYLLDEPSVGLHPRDTGRLVQILKSLRDLGNTVVVVEHEEAVIEQADFLVDMGPEAGVNGGHVVFAGRYADIGEAAPESLTAQYMSGSMGIPLPLRRRVAREFLEIRGGRQHNLKNIDVRIPLNCLTVVSGVSGSGKTTLVRDLLYPALLSRFPDQGGRAPGLFDGLVGPVERITQVEFINQSPIGKSSRSNPVTYVKAYDFIRDLFASQQLSKIRGFQPRHFSFNVEGGRCEACKGDGEQVVEMQFLADVHLECEACRGERFNREVLEITYQGKNIFEVLQLSIAEALVFFKENKEIIRRIQPLLDVGLGYVQLGQSSSTLSGGEAQRVKLASFLIRENSHGQLFFIFDEPTTGLHFHDIDKLLRAIQALVDKGHTVMVVEHNLEIIKSADWVIDLGPEAGMQGGYLVYEGVPEGLPAVPESLTGKYLRGKL
jgi:excinuclease ABC subunit A